MKFASNAALGYHAARRSFCPGETLQFDEAYRRAHLPLVNPAHPLVIAADEDYRHGRYAARRYSLVVPINADALENSDLFRTLDRHMRRAPFAKHIAWPIMAQRRGMLHATLCGGFSEQALPALIATLQAWVTSSIKPAFLIGGLFNGHLNTGRLYLKIYPELRGEENTFQAIQQAAGKSASAMWLAGYYHFQHELCANKTQALAETLALFGDHYLLQQTCSELWLLATHDDLALSANVIQRFPFAE